MGAVQTCSHTFISLMGFQSITCCVLFLWGLFLLYLLILTFIRFFLLFLPSPCVLVLILFYSSFFFLTTSFLLFLLLFVPFLLHLYPFFFHLPLSFSTSSSSFHHLLPLLLAYSLPICYLDGSSYMVPILNYSFHILNNPWLKILRGAFTISAAFGSSQSFQFTNIPFS